jgi:hypothetical protein
VAVLARVDDIEAGRLEAWLDDAFALVAGRFRRWEVRVRARACLAGMLPGLERKTGWSLAEHAGERTPDGWQRLRPASSTPATGHDGATATSNEHATATASGNASKITKCG